MGRPSRASSSYSPSPADEVEGQPFMRDSGWNPNFRKFEVDYTGQGQKTNDQKKCKNIIIVIGCILFGIFVGFVAAESGHSSTEYSIVAQDDGNIPTSTETSTPTSLWRIQSSENDEEKTNTIDKEITQLALHPAFARIAQIVVTRGDDANAIQVHFSAIENVSTLDTVCGESIPGGGFSLHFWVNGEKATTIRAVDAIRVGCFVGENTATPKLHMFVANFDNLKDAGLYQYEIGQAAAFGVKGATSSLLNRILFHLGNASMPNVTLNGKSLSDIDNKQTIVTVGDMDMEAAKIVVDGIASEKHFSLLIHLGDGSYASNSGDCYAGDELEACQWNCARTDEKCGGRTRTNAATANTWTNWHDIMDKITSAVPFVTTTGNHDNDLHWALKFRPPVPNTRKPNVLESDISDGENANLAELYGMQSTGDSLSQQLVVNELLANPHFFSFDHGLMHVVSLGSEDNPINPYELLKQFGGENSKKNRERFESHYGFNSAQYKWLIRDLEKAHLNRDKVPWIIVYTHRPPYHTSSHHPNCLPDGDWFGCKWRDLYSHIFEEAGVNLVISGHSHHYMRTWPIKQNRKANLGDPHAPVYIVCGTGGYNLYGGWLSHPRWVAFRQGDDFGYCKFTLVNATQLEWSFIATREKNVKKKLDTATITQPPHRDRPKTISLVGS